MSGISHIKWSIPLLLSSAISFAHEDAIVDHHDLIHVDKSLTLTQVISLTLEKYPEQLVNSALEQEATALQRRGDSLLAGAPSVGVRYQDDLPGDDIGSREIEAELELPLWNWGQRSAGQAVAEQAHIAANKQSTALKLKVAGLVRSALWDMKLESLRYEQAKSMLDISEKLLSKINRRVELGDLPRSDALLAKSEQLHKRSLLLQAEADLMHARKNYISLTQMSDIPAQFTEPLSTTEEVTSDHPALSAINALIKRKQTEVEWIKSAGSGQTSIKLGGKNEKGSDSDDDIESMTVEISMPFGGSAHLAPEIATANLELTEALVQRAQIFRELEKQHHEAKHKLQVTRTDLKIAHELKEIAEHHLKMTQLSFSAGEINLMDLLKIQARTFDAIRHAREREVLLQKNIALYNQAVGEQP